jgi:hypothetical protein
VSCIFLIMTHPSVYILPILSLLLFSNFTHVSAVAVDGVNMLAGKDPLGESLESWAIKYWRWWIAVPPGIEANSCVMYLVPNSSIVFLINPWTMNYQGNCDIPSDRHILVPLLVGECDTTLPDGKSGKVEDLWRCAESADEPFESWNIVLDNNVISRNWGNEVVNPNLINETLVRNSDKFMIDIPKNNNVDVEEAGSYPAVVDGYYLVLKPLSPGDHKLEYAINQKKIGTGVGNVPPIVGGSAVYNLHVR